MTRAKSIARTADRPDRSKRGKITRRQSAALAEQHQRGGSLRSWLDGLAAAAATVPKGRQGQGAEPTTEGPDDDVVLNATPWLDGPAYSPAVDPADPTGPSVRSAKATRVNAATGRPSRKARKGRRAYRI